MKIGRTDVLDMLWAEPIKVGHWVGFKDLTDLNNEWLRSFLWADADQTLLAHRGSYKTTVASLFLAIHAVIDPNGTVLFFRKTDSDVKEVMKQTAKIIGSEAMRELTRIIYGRPAEFTKLTDSEISTDLVTSIRGQSQIVALGTGTSVTGKHADIVMTDDIVNIKDRISRAEREATKLFYQELQNVKNRGGRFINTGTPWHKDDAISMMPGVSRHDCYQTGLVSKEELGRLRQSMSDSLFAANYELRHIADSEAMFKDPGFCQKGEAFGGTAHIDAAYGGGDWTAYTVMKKTADGWRGFGKTWHRHVDDCLAEIDVLHKEHGAGSVFLELNADKGYLARELRTRGFCVNTYHEKMNKFIKISSYLRQAWGSLLWEEDTDPEYLAQVLDYTEHAEHDDCPDSAASLIREMTRTRAQYNSTITGGI